MIKLLKQLTLNINKKHDIYRQLNNKEVNYVQSHLYY